MLLTWAWPQCVLLTWAWPCLGPREKWQSLPPALSVDVDSVYRKQPFICLSSDVYSLTTVLFSYWDFLSWRQRDLCPSSADTIAMPPCSFSSGDRARMTSLLKFPSWSDPLSVKGCFQCVPCSFSVWKTFSSCSYLYCCQPWWLHHLTWFPFACVPLRIASL